MTTDTAASLVNLLGFNYWSRPLRHVALDGIGVQARTEPVGPAYRLSGICVECRSFRNSTLQAKDRNSNASRCAIARKSCLCRSRIWFLLSPMVSAPLKNSEQ